MASFRNEGLWPQDSVRDAAESLGIQNVPQEILRIIADDVEYRLSELIEESLKYMRHAKRTKLKTDDVDHALRARNMEPLWGFNGLRPTTYRRINTANGNIYVIDDEEVDLSKVLKGKLPDIPRDVSFTAHWLAIEGVQPSIPQNPSSADIKALHPQPTYTSTLTSQATTVRPLVRHTLSKELQLYFSRFTAAALSNDSAQRLAALASLRNDNGLHQLVPYFCRWFASEVTASLDDLSVLDHVLVLIEGLLQNRTLHVEPYIHQLLPSILSILLSSSLPLQNDIGGLTHLILRTHASSLLKHLLQKYASFYPTLSERLLLTFLRALVSPVTEGMEREEETAGVWGTKMGAVLGVETLGMQAVRVWLGGNLGAIGRVVEKEGETMGEERERDHFVEIVLDVLKRNLIPEHIPTPNEPVELPEFGMIERKFGMTFGGRIFNSWDDWGSELAKALGRGAEDPVAEGEHLTDLEELFGAKWIPDSLLGGLDGEDGGEWEDGNGFEELGREVKEGLRSWGLEGLAGLTGEGEGVGDGDGDGDGGIGMGMEMGVGVGVGSVEMDGQDSATSMGEEQGYGQMAIAKMLAGESAHGHDEPGHAGGQDEFDAGLNGL